MFGENTLNYIISVCPFIIYWATCIALEILKIGNVEQNLLNRNKVSRSEVFYNVLGVTISSTFGNIVIVYLGLLDLQKFRLIYLALGIWWIDTAEFFVHYLLHKVNFLYVNFHKEHHQLHYPYHFGALYNSMFEATFTSSILFIGFILIGFSYQEFIFATTCAYMATVIDHTFTDEGNRFHYLHHTKLHHGNFQQPFFTYYDRLFGTYMK
eukprot:TRINITY_DN5120_c0_g1_i1.p1 TRINITY_DN5120_c0_g1~~TRINITY_DN5120_c0_g1_i1.p1  ORF type:complete len:210 (+),score=28.94 TRINITY_DN5120_c0_g1_i1:21-650(+)